MNQAQPMNPAEAYQQYFVPAMFRPWAGILLRHAAPQPGERLLDVACGTGIVAREAAPMVGASGAVVALDMNPAMLAVARALPAPSGTQIQWQPGNATALPCPDGAFDIVTCQHGLPFFPDRPAALAEMRRVLVPGGRAVAMVLQGLARHPVFEALMKSVASQLSVPLASVATPFAMSDVEELRGLFGSAGFQSVTIAAETTPVRFAEPARFVPLAVTSSAAAVPAFAQLDMPERQALLDAVRADVEPMLQAYRQADAIGFPMFAQVVLARK